MSFPAITDSPYIEPWRDGSRLHTPPVPQYTHLVNVAPDGEGLTTHVVRTREKENAINISPRLWRMWDPTITQQSSIRPSDEHGPSDGKDAQDSQDDE